MEHRIMILGSLGEFVELVKLSKKRGYYTVVCDGYENGPAKAYADKSYCINVRDVEAVAKVCKEEKVDGIIASFSDLLFEKMVEIADLAGIPCYQKPEKLPYYREKPVAKKLLAELGVRVPKNKQISKDFKDEELKDMQFPVIIKPINGYGSKGIFLVKSIEEIREKFDEVVDRATKADILVEEFSQGREYNMMTWLVDGKVYPISIADRERTHRGPDVFPMLNRVAYPSKNISKVFDEATEVLQKFANATGQKRGPLSMQFFYNEHGVEVCEIAGRLFGYEHELVTYCCGLSIEELLLDHVYEPEKEKETVLNHDPFFTKHTTGLYFNGRDGMLVSDMSAAEELQQHPNCLESVLFYNVGEITDNFGPKPYIARYYITGETREEVDNLTQMYFDKCSVKDNEGNEILYKHILEL